MNATFKKIIAWIGGLTATVLAFLVGRRCSADRKRITDLKNIVDDSRKEADGIGDRNREIEQSVERARDTADELADNIRESAVSMQRAGEAIADAHTAIADGLRIIAEAEKRNSGDND